MPTLKQNKIETYSENYLLCKKNYKRFDDNQNLFVHNIHSFSFLSAAIKKIHISDIIKR